MMNYGPGRVQHLWNGMYVPNLARGQGVRVTYTISPGPNRKTS